MRSASAQFLAFRAASRASNSLLDLWLLSTALAAVPNGLPDANSESRAFFLVSGTYLMQDHDGNNVSSHLAVRQNSLFAEELMKLRDHFRRVQIVADRVQAPDWRLGREHSSSVSYQSQHAFYGFVRPS